MRKEVKWLCTALEFNNMADDGKLQEDKQLSLQLPDYDVVTMAWNEDILQAFQLLVLSEIVQRFRSLMYYSVFFQRSCLLNRTSRICRMLAKYFDSYKDITVLMYISGRNCFLMFVSEFLLIVSIENVTFHSVFYLHVHLSYYKARKRIQMY